MLLLMTETLTVYYHFLWKKMSVYLDLARSKALLLNNHVSPNFAFFSKLIGVDGNSFSPDPSPFSHWPREPILLCFWFAFGNILPLWNDSQNEHAYASLIFDCIQAVGMEINQKKMMDFVNNLNSSPIINILLSCYVLIDPELNAGLLSFSKSILTSAPLGCCMVDCVFFLILTDLYRCSMFTV